MADLGDIEIRPRPLIIREAIVGGRKLTKALYLQLPDLTCYPGSEDGTRIVAWVELHWKDCSYTEWSDGLGYDHRHVLAAKGDAPCRGVVHSPAGGPIEIVNHEAAKAFAALLARKKIEGQAQKITNTKNGAWRISAQRNGQPILLEFYNGTPYEPLTYSSYLNISRGEPDKGLVVLAQLGVDQEALLAAVDKEIAQELEWRKLVKDTWRLVTEETPQVFL